MWYDQRPDGLFYRIGIVRCLVQEHISPARSQVFGCDTRRCRSVAAGNWYLISGKKKCILSKR